MKYFIGLNILLFLVSIFSVKEVELVEEVAEREECKKIKDEFNSKMDEIHKNCREQKEEIRKQLEQHCWTGFGGDMDAVETCLLKKKEKETELYNVIIRCIDQKLEVLQKYKDKLKGCQPVRKAKRGKQKGYIREGHD